MASTSKTQFQKRRRLRLMNYDYAAPGGYFITVCTHHRHCLFGDIVDGEMHGNAVGRAVESCWSGLPDHYDGLSIDGFVLMPNHIHGLLFLEERLPRPHELSEIVRALKSFSARRANILRHGPGQPLWQRGFHDHIVRGEAALAQIREYIANNPARWHLDRNHPANFVASPTGRSETGPYERSGSNAGAPP